MREEEERRKKEREDRKRALEEQEMGDLKKREEIREDKIRVRETEYTPPVFPTLALNGVADHPKEEEVVKERYGYVPSKRLIDKILDVVNDHPNTGHKGTTHSWW